MTLNIPNSGLLQTLSSDDTKGFLLSDSLRISSGTRNLSCYKQLTPTQQEVATMVYVDKDCIIKFSNSEAGTTNNYDCSFKKGWNYMYSARTKSGATRTYNVTASQTLRSGYNWVEMATTDYDTTRVAFIE
jgi:hypothetical protein